MESGLIPLQSDRPSDVFDGNLGLADLQSNRAEKMDRINVIRLDQQDLPVDLLGSLQPAGLMMLECSR